MSRLASTRSRADETTNWEEPACWGSAELPLLPQIVGKATTGVKLRHVVRSGRKKVSDQSVDLVDLTYTDWKNRIGVVSVVDTDLTLQQLAVMQVEELFKLDQDLFDLPFMSTPLDDFAGLIDIPFERSTHSRLVESGIDSDLDVMVLLTGTFREVVERLGDVRAAVDFAVTGAAWVGEIRSGRFGVLQPLEPKTLTDAIKCARYRVFRSVGLSPDASFYTEEVADVLGRRWGIGLENAATLEACADLLAVSRERVRQMSHYPLWDSAERRWPRPRLLDVLYNSLLDPSATTFDLDEIGESIHRTAALELLGTYGYDLTQLKAPATLAEELSLSGIKLKELRRMAYTESERLGFMTITELAHHTKVNYPTLSPEMVSRVLAEVPLYRDLPHGYVYLEQSMTSYFKSWMKSLLAVLGPQQIDEAYEASKRFAKVRIPRLVLPPRSVIEAFFGRSDEFWFEDGFVGMVDPYQNQLIGVEKWVYDTISESTGHVIHRTKLWDLARESGVRLGTLSVYSSYSLYFKPLPGGFVTLTGHYPSDIALELARSRAQAIQVPTRRESVTVSDGDVIITIQAGNSILDTGTLGSTKEIREMLEGRTFRSMAAGRQFGNIGWSGSALFGFTAVLQELKVQPGDSVVLRFSVQDEEVTASLSSE